MSRKTNPKPFTKETPKIGDHPGQPARTPDKVFAVAFVLMLIALATAKMLAARDLRQQLEFDPNHQAVRPGVPKPVQTPYSMGFQSPVTNTGDRVTESLALLQALAVAQLQWQPSGRIPTDVRGLVEPLAAGKLLPPGISFQNGKLQSDRSDLIVRYRPVPYGIEILSQPRDAFGGPVMLLRSPALALVRPGRQVGPDGPPVDFFVWLRRDVPQLPPPFASNATVGLTGWSEQPLSVTPVPPAERNDMERFLHQNQKGALSSP